MGGIKNEPEAFYHSKKWKQKREKILRRDKYLCQECKRYGRKRDGMPIKAEIVHHIEPFEMSPEKRLDDSNLVSLCEACHNKKHPERNRITKIAPPRYDKKNEHDR
jgi:5-methylcytosine-specific restriction endonuclease McrA